MKQLHKNLFLTSAIIILILNGCKKRTEVKENTVYISPSNISTEYLTDKILIPYTPFSSTAILVDSIITSTIDINHDGQTDITAYIEIYHSDTIAWIKSYLRKTNPEIEILCQEQDTVLLLSCYTDQQSYITPNPSLWRHSSLKDEYIMNECSIRRCDIGGIMYNCYDHRKPGLFRSQAGSQRYFIGFRIKNSTIAQNSYQWNYGYLQTTMPGSGPTLILEKIAIENNIDQPILMQTTFPN